MATSPETAVAVLVTEVWVVVAAAAWGVGEVDARLERNATSASVMGITPVTAVRIRTVATSAMSLAILLRIVLRILIQDLFQDRATTVASKATCRKNVLMQTTRLATPVVTLAI